MNDTVAGKIASTLAAQMNCQASGNAQWQAKHAERIETICREDLPSGAGIDSGVTLEVASTPERLVFSAPYHAMENGSYVGWIDCTVIVTASLVYGINVEVKCDDDATGDYIGDIMHDALSATTTN